MKQYIHFCLLALILLTLSVNAQKIENVDFKVQDKKIIVSYDLTNCPDHYSYDISLKFKTESGKIIYPQNPYGDIKEVTQGTGKTITWDVLGDKQEIKENITAIVEISNTISARKSYEPEMVDVNDGFKRLPSGLEYKIFKHGKGTKTPNIGYNIDMNIKIHVPDKKVDSVIFDSRKMNNNKPVPFAIKAPAFKGDPVEAFMLLVAGDSAVIRISIDSLKKRGNQLLPWMKEGHKIIYNISVVDVLRPEDKIIADSINASKQNAIDDKLLHDYFKTHNIQPNKTGSGLYYTISKEGIGENSEDGWNAKIIYTGKFMNGKAFDSNVDTSFHHSEPFNLEIGKGKVIKGWDEGLKLLKKGSVATLYIPSSLAYGATERQNIPANSIMIFDIEVLDMYDKTQTDDNLIQKYLKDNNINAQQTASGLYYKLTREGSGDKPKAGQKVVVNYTGMTVTGKKFDSNIDPTFQHVQPFTFPLGQGQVIKGWDEGIALLKKGSKATLYIPSALAYGTHSPTPAIPPNSVLIFDVELVDIQ